MSTETSNILGKIPCPVCSTPVVLRANKNDLAYLGCSECGCQVMTRGRPADRMLRAKLAPASNSPALEPPKREEKKPPAKPAAGAAAGKSATSTGDAAGKWW